MSESPFEIEMASIEDACEIAALIKSVQDAMPNKDFFVASSPERVERELRENSFAFLAKDGSKLVGAFLFAMPGLNCVENLGYKIGLSEEELKRVLDMGTVAVGPDYRGLGIQRKLLALGEEEGIRRGFDIFTATVDPRNTPSLRNFINAGYDIALVKEGFYQRDAPRAVLLKRADGKKPELEQRGDGLMLQ